MPCSVTAHCPVFFWWCSPSCFLTNDLEGIVPPVYPTWRFLKSQKCRYLKCQKGCVFCSCRARAFPLPLNLEPTRRSCLGYMNYEAKNPKSLNTRGF